MQHAPVCSILQSPVAMEQLTFAEFCSAVMALGPIGPFCPFRSKSGGFEEIDREMGLLSYQAGDLARRFQGITTGLTSGVMPDKDAVKQLADEMYDVNGACSSCVRRQCHDSVQASRVACATASGARI